MGRLIRIALKDITIWLRDPAALGVLLAMPAVLILILGSALGGMGGGSSDFAITVAVVNQDVPVSSASGQKTAVGEEITTGFTENEALKDLFRVDVRDNAEEVRSDVEHGNLAGALIIPATLSKDISDGKPVKLEVLRDPGSELASGILESVVRSLANDLSRISVVAQTTGQLAGKAGMRPEIVGALVGQAVAAATEASQTAPVTVEKLTAKREAKQITPLDYYSVSMTSMFLMFGAMFGSFAFITERREQTMARLLTTPTPRSAFVGGKMLGIFLLGMLQFGVLYAYTNVVMKVNWGGNVLGTTLVAAAEVAATTGLAVLIASIAKTERGAGGIGPLVIQVMALIGGAFFQITILPGWLQPIRYLSVVGWALEGFQKVQMQNAGVGGVLAPVGALMAFAVVFFGIGVWRLRDSR